MAITISDSDLIVIDFAPQAFPFREWLSGVLQTEDLEGLHRGGQVTPASHADHASRLVARIAGHHGELERLTAAFVRTVIAESFGPIEHFDRRPQVQFHLAVEAAELEAERQDLLQLGPDLFLERHYDLRRRGLLFGRNSPVAAGNQLVSVWLPLTQVSGANSLWIGGRDLRGRGARPVVAHYGQALLFDGVNRWYGAIWNMSGITRVSLELGIVFGRARVPHARG